MSRLPGLKQKLIDDPAARVKILFFAANPTGTNPTALQEEVRQIRQKLRASDHRDVLELVTWWAVRPDDLLQALSEHPTAAVVHFSGRGSPTGQIVLQDDAGQPRPVPVQALGKLFEAFRGNPVPVRLAFLNGCFNDEQARAIVRPIDCVAGTTRDADERTAVVFAASFYRALGFGRTFQEAFDQGSAALELEGIAVAKGVVDVLPWEVRVDNSLKMSFARVPPGKFLMGAPESERAGDADERPVHEVEITRAFHLGVYPVTQAEYQAVVGVNPSWFGPLGKGRGRVGGLDVRRFPVESLSWTAAADFCRRLSERPEEKQAGRRYRLPTEAEWEYACRAGASDLRPFYGPAGGVMALSSREANCDGAYPYGPVARGPFLDRPTPVGLYPPNPLGLYDLHGNVWEWCADWYAEDGYRSSPARDPSGPAEGQFRVARGGCFNTPAEKCRAACRQAFLPHLTPRNVGLRVVLDLSLPGGGP